jgi:hypothetical protein
MKVRCNYGRYASQHILDDGKVYILHRYVSGTSGPQPQYDTVYFPCHEGDDVVDVDGTKFVAVGDIPGDCVVA